MIVPLDTPWSSHTTLDKPIVVQSDKPLACDRKTDPGPETDPVAVTQTVVASAFPTVPHDDDDVAERVVTKEKARSEMWRAFR